MKVVVLTVAMFLGTMIYANASVTKDVVTSNTEVAAVQQTGFVDVKIESLNAKVQEAVKAFEATYTVKSLAYDKTTKQTQVTLVAKADKKEKVVILDDSGKEVKPAKK